MGSISKGRSRTSSLNPLFITRSWTRPTLRSPERSSTTPSWCITTPSTCSLKMPIEGSPFEGSLLRSPTTLVTTSGSTTSPKETPPPTVKPSHREEWSRSLVLLNPRPKATTNPILNSLILSSGWRPRGSRSSMRSNNTSRRRRGSWRRTG